MRCPIPINYVSAITSERLAVPKAIADYVDAIHLVRLPSRHLRDTHLALVPAPGARQWFYRGQEAPPGRGSGVPLRVFVSGPQTRTIRLPFLQHQRELVSVVYRPGVLYRLTGVPQGRLVDVCAPAEELFGAARSPPAAVRAFDSVGDGLRGALPSLEACIVDLCEGLEPATAFDAVVTRIVTAAPHDHPCVRELADECYMGLRQFERTCQMRLGFSPKVFLRLVRFAAAIEMKRGEPAARWIDIALRCGYFDQMHFIHDFKAFTGSVPSALLSAGDGGWCVFGDRSSTGAEERRRPTVAFA